MSELPSTRESLIAALQTGRKDLEAALSNTSAGQFEIAGLHDGWSVKDVLAHLGYWQARVLTRFAVLRDGGHLDPVNDLDAINARALSEWRELPVDEVRRREREAYDGLLTIAREASPAELFDPAHFAGANGTAFVQTIANNTWEHYAEHLVEWVAWLAGGLRP